MKQCVIVKTLLQVYRSHNNLAPGYIDLWLLHACTHAHALQLDHWGPTLKICSWLPQEPGQPGETAAMPRLVPSCGMPCQSTSRSLTRLWISKRYWKHTFSPQPSSVTVKLTLKLSSLVITHLNVYVLLLGVLLREVLLAQLLRWHP